MIKFTIQIWHDLTFLTKIESDFNETSIGKIILVTGTTLKLSISTPEEKSTRFGNYGKYSPLDWYVEQNFDFWPKFYFFSKQWSILSQWFTDLAFHMKQWIITFALSDALLFIALTFPFFILLHQSLITTLSHNGPRPFRLKRGVVFL